MRTKQSLKNIFSSCASYLITVLVGFFARSYFLKLLGTEYLGINSLFGNIISVMSVVELGFGSAIIYNLYEPLSCKNIEQIRSLINFYKYVYRIIAIIVFSIGTVIMPFIPTIVGTTSVTDNLYALFFLFLLDTTLSYLLTYKRSIFYADQRSYIINLTHAVLHIVVNTVQIIVLFSFQNYIAFLIIQIIFHILENVIISIWADSEYSYLRDKRNIKPLDRETKKDIIQKVKGLFVHQLGSAVVLGTDNIIISMTKTLGIIAVGKYANYIMITSNLNAFTSQIFTSVTASVGNLLIEKKADNAYNVYKRILFLNAAISNFMCVSIFCIMEPFISIWVGQEYILPKSVLLVITINFYIQGMKRTCGIFKYAAGIFYEDRYVPLAESIINLIFSILFVKLFGLSGIVLGTIASSVVHWCYSFPVFVYKKIFNRNLKDYFRDYIKYVLMFIVSIVSSYGFIAFLGDYNNAKINFLVATVSCIIIPNIIFIIAFAKFEEFKYWKQILFSKYEAIMRRR